MNKKIILVIPIILLTLAFGLFMCSFGFYYVWLIVEPQIDSNKIILIKFFNDTIKNLNKLLNKFIIFNNIPELVNKNKIVMYSINSSLCFLFALMSTMVFLNSSIRWFKEKKSLFPYVYTFISIGFLVFTIFNGVKLLFVCSLMPLVLLILSLPTFKFYINKKTIIKEKQIKKNDEAIVEEIKQTMNEIEQQAPVVEQGIVNFCDNSINDFEDDFEEYDQPISTKMNIEESTQNCIDQQIQSKNLDTTIKVDQQRLLEQEQETNKNLEELKNRACGLTNFLSNSNQQKLEQSITPQLTPTERVQQVREIIGEERIRPVHPEVVQIDKNRLLEQESETNNLLYTLKNRVSLLESHLKNIHQKLEPILEQSITPQLTPTERVQQVREIIGEERIRPVHPEILKLDQEKIIEQIIKSENNIVALQNKFANIQSKWDQLQSSISNNSQLIDEISEDDMLEDEEIDEIIVDQKSNIEQINNIDQNICNQISQQPIEDYVEIIKVNQQALLERQQIANQNIDNLKNRFSNIRSNWDKQQTINSMLMDQNIQQQSNDFVNLSSNPEIQKMFELIKNKRQHRG